MTASINLIVVNPFNDYQRGSCITDAEIIKDILNPESESHHFSHYVRRVDAELPTHDYVLTTTETTEEAPTIEISTVSAVKPEEESLVEPVLSDDDTQAHPIEDTEHLGDDE